MDIRYRYYLYLYSGVCKSPRNLNRDTATGFCPFLAKKTGRGFVRKKPLVKPVLQVIGILCNSGAITPIIVKKIPSPDGHLDEHKYDMIVMVNMDMKKLFLERETAYLCL